jgi:hypothetical protein
MSIQGVFCAQANILGMIQRGFSVSLYRCYSLVNSWNRVRAGIRDGHGDYLVTASSWPMFLYANLTCDQDDLEKGLFKGSMLVTASILTSYIDAFLSADVITGLQVNIYVSILCH